MRNARTIALSDGGHLNLRIDGPEGAPCVIFSNSVMTDLSIWNAQAGALSGAFRVLRYDQRGHGGSSEPEGPMSFAGYGADVIALLDACGVERCTFVGLSMGVPTGLAAYAAAPQRFERFVAVNGLSRSAPGREAFWTERRESARAEGIKGVAEDTALRWMAGTDKNDPALVRLRSMTAAMTLKGFTAATHALQSYDHSGVASALACPFLGITGEKDGAMPEVVREQFARVPGARFADIPGAGHLPNFQAPDAFNIALLAFLDATATEIAKETR